MREYTLSDGRKVRGGVAVTLPDGTKLSARCLDGATEEELRRRFGVTGRDVPDPEPPPETPARKRERRETEEIGVPLSPVERALIAASDGDARALDAIKAKLLQIDGEAGR